MCSLRSEDHPGSWLSATRPAWLAESEIRAPATLVDATSYATADAGSIPAVSTGCSGCEILSISPRCRCLTVRRARSFARRDSRCLRDDLGIELPTVDVDPGSIEHR